MHRYAWIALAFALSGCMLGPDYQRPQTTLPTGYCWPLSEAGSGSAT